MSKLRRTSWIAVLALAACGGAGTTIDPVAQSAAQVQGAILEVDGQTLDRDGVDVQVVETGDLVRSGADGSFRFPDLESGRYTLDFNPNALRTLALEGEGESGSGEEKEESNEEPKDEPNKEEKESEEEEGEQKESDGEKPNEDEESDERDEDKFGRPRVDVDREGPKVIIKVVLENGEVVRWSKSHPNHRFVRTRMQRADGAADGVRGQIRLREWFRGERESLRFIVCGLDGGDAVEVFLRNSTVEGSEFKSVRDAQANGDGCASVAFDTKGGWLPLEAESLSDLAGYDVQIRMAADGAVILNGEIPALPERVERHEKDGEQEGEKEKEGEEDGEHEEKPEVAPATYGKDRLMAKVDFVFGSVEIWDWSAENRRRFRMVAGGLREGETVRFQIRRRETEEWTTFASPVAKTRAEEGESFIARFDTEWFGELPLDAESVEQLVGLGVRVVRETDDGDIVLMIGEVPELLRD